MMIEKMLKSPPILVRLRDGRFSGPARAALFGATLLLALSASATAAGAPPGFETKPRTALQSSFDRGTKDYALRSCDRRRGVRVRIRGKRGWRSRTDGRRFRRGSYVRRLARGAGQGATLTFKRRRDGARRRYHLRCLPKDFPRYSFERTRHGGPAFFILQLGRHYAAILNRDGVPVWWFKAGGEPDNAELLADGTLAWAPVDEISFQVGDYEIRSLRGRLLRTVDAGEGDTADIHELLLLDNGNYLLGAQVEYTEDASAHGGSPDSRVVGIEIREVTKAGEVVWRWSSRDHIGLEETGRWWDEPILDNEPYDVVHWNSVEDDGDALLLSFRHLDAVYKIDRSDGGIVWKLGGTPTAESLKLVGDRFAGHPLGGQHDARVMRGGAVTVYDNRTGLAAEAPRAVRYRVNEGAGTARLVQEIADPAIAESFCCGSARRLLSGDWLIGWGGTGTSAAYDRKGRRLFTFSLDVGFSYRANEVEPGILKTRRLRRAMDHMARP